MRIRGYAAVHCAALPRRKGVRIDHDTKCVQHTQPRKGLYTQRARRPVSCCTGARPCVWALQRLVKNHTWQRTRRESNAGRSISRLVPQYPADSTQLPSGQSAKIAEVASRLVWSARKVEPEHESLVFLALIMEDTMIGLGPPKEVTLATF